MSVLAYDNPSSDSDYQKYDIHSGEVSYYSFEDIPDSNDGGYSPGYFPNGCKTWITAMGSEGGNVD